MSGVEVKRSGQPRTDRHAGETVSLNGQSARIRQYRRSRHPWGLWLSGQVCLNAAL